MPGFTPSRFQPRTDRLSAGLVLALAARTAGADREYPLAFPPMIQGLRTVLYPAPDLARAKAWYTEVFGVAPYFDQPFYVGFNIGGFELGLVPDAPPAKPASGVVAMWGVSDVGAEVARFHAQGATIHEEPRDVGDGITVASVLDPFGNIIGLITNPHFDPKAVR